MHWLVPSSQPGKLLTCSQLGATLWVNPQELHSKLFSQLWKNFYWALILLELYILDFFCVRCFGLLLLKLLKELGFYPSVK